MHVEYRRLSSQGDALLRALPAKADNYRLRAQQASQASLTNQLMTAISQDDLLV